MEFLKKGAIIDVDDKESIDVEVKKWGGKVKVRGFSGEDQLEYDKLEAAAKAKNEPWHEERLFTLSRCLLDQDGQPLFPGEAGMKELSKKDSVTLQKLYDVAYALSTQTVEDRVTVFESLKKVTGSDSSSDCLSL